MAGYVYLIGSSTFHWYKIGKSITPDIRINDLGILLPFKIQIFAIWRARDHSLLESVLHEKYAGFHVHGEWFSFSKEKLLEVIFKDVPEEVRIFPNSEKTFAPVKSSVERDSPAGTRVNFKINPSLPEDADYSAMRSKWGRKGMNAKIMQRLYLRKGDKTTEHKF